MSLISSIEPSRRRRLLYALAAFVLVALVALGAMATNGWLPHTDALSGKKSGWFGSELPKNASPTPEISDTKNVRAAPRYLGC